MKKAVLIGRTNAGKSLLTVNLAEYLGKEKILVAIGEGRGQRRTFQWTPAEARRRLVSENPYTTRSLQETVVAIPVGKGRQGLALVDTGGLDDGIHPDEEVRRSMAVTVEAVEEADLVLHVLDAARVGRLGKEEGIGPLEFQINDFCAGRPYAVLANKMDLEGAKAGLAIIRDSFPRRRVIQVSALKKTGLAEVRDYVAAVFRAG